jgi:hypothetical protein
MIRRQFLALLAAAPFAPDADNDYAWLIYEDDLTVIAYFLAQKRAIKSDLARLDRMKDDDIDYSDIPPLA